MGKKFFLSSVVALCLYGNLYAEPASKEDIRILRDDNKILIQQIDKRFDMLMWFIGILTTISTISIAYVVKRQERHEENFREFKEVHLTPTEFIHTVRLMNPEERKELKQLLR